MRLPVVSGQVAGNIRNRKTCATVAYRACSAIGQCPVGGLCARAEPATLTLLPDGEN